MGIRKAINDGNINIIVRGDKWGTQLDVSITPIFCVKCNKQLPELYEHMGSRYGQVGTIQCDFCGTNIYCVDNDNIVEKLCTTGYILDYYKLYKLEDEIWGKVKDVIEYDITSRHVGNTVTLDYVINEICQEFSITLKDNNYFISEDGKITKFPKSVTKWFDLLQTLSLY
ncbi:hypothetical protein [Metabacillus bambusae]|uniref:Uncharacterized protein n=1 Tax=Metabacillus bambusae TaxID=2795218 RepID=A0ABS3N8E6_9BACI|nr:hypothetical protein [Metabacillus bambusae]MBO1514415.1 hypothetical protein [Metabacillus bambusae]